MPWGRWRSSDRRSGTSADAAAMTSAACSASPSSKSYLRDNRRRGGRRRRRLDVTSALCSMTTTALGDSLTILVFTTRTRPGATRCAAPRIIYAAPAFTCDDGHDNCSHRCSITADFSPQFTVSGLWGHAAGSPGAPDNEKWNGLRHNRRRQNPASSSARHQSASPPSYI